MSCKPSAPGGGEYSNIIQLCCRRSSSSSISLIEGRSFTLAPPAGRPQVACIWCGETRKCSDFHRESHEQPRTTEGVPHGGDFLRRGISPSHAAYLGIRGKTSHFHLLEAAPSHNL